ncbi:hypothetical protein PAXRUDRAFT_513597 [Paxillus rubicundulus Ve08.2h10]|uniref:Unplaced genomic scaffold scaffold_360, whole genome shotgun sequence n=1 Tax=Paxillus rubicundulus Ve08.2h10 TaxID=930991 RepID=A0A0D0D930_9AGAM|nr:hypothetical protein PAXRUDRAFT_513597 [Paxillus rubicundulus Ve08.2h10]
MFRSSALPISGRPLGPGGSGSPLPCARFPQDLSTNMKQRANPAAHAMAVIIGTGDVIEKTEDWSVPWMPSEHIYKRLLADGGARVPWDLANHSRVSG